MPDSQFELFKDKADPSKFRWRFQAKNSEIVAQSAARHGIDVIKQEAASADVVDKT
jgi:uncharacterized protein YegP (UPF0339 family)